MRSGFTEKLLKVLQIFYKWLVTENTLQLSEAFVRPVIYLTTEKTDQELGWRTGAEPSGFVLHPWALMF